MGIAIHFYIADDDHAYLLMIDPSASATLSATVTVASMSVNPVTLDYWATVPDAVAAPTSGYPTDGATLPANLPDESATAWYTALRSESGMNSYAIPMIVDQDPVLIRCTERLSVTWA